MMLQLSVFTLTAWIFNIVVKFHFCTYLNQIIDVGWITCCQTAEDYQNLSACMSWHVPKESIRLIYFCTLSYLYVKVSKNFMVLEPEDYMIWSPLQIIKDCGKILLWPPEFHLPKAKPFPYPKYSIWLCTGYLIVFSKG